MIPTVLIRRRARLGYALLTIACGPGVSDSDRDSADGTTSASGDGATAPSGTGAADASTSDGGAAGSTSGAGTTGSVADGSSGDGGSSDGGIVEGEPVCLVEEGFGIVVNGPHHADVDGNGAAELWQVILDEPAIIRAHLPTIEGAEVSYETTRDGIDFEFADIDGDGRDDLVAIEDATISWYAGQADGTLADTPAPITIDGSFAATLADVDDDGDDDLFRLQPGTPVVLEVLENEGGVFSLVGSAPLPDTVERRAEATRIVARQDALGVAIQLGAEGGSGPDDIILDVRLTADLAIDIVAASTVASYRIIGEGDVDGDGEPDILASRHQAPAEVILSFHREGDVLVENVFRDVAAWGAIGDFEGTGSPQLLYRQQDVQGEPWPTRLYRFDEGTDSEVIVDDPFSVPVYRRAFDYDLDGAAEAYAEYCEFVCSAGMAELVPCD